MMKAVTVKAPGGSEQLQVVDFEKPKPGPGELLIDVKAAAVNRTDIVNREGVNGYVDFPILGVEVAGVVEAVGEDVDMPVGSHVMGLVNGGAYAEYALMPEGRAMIVPDNLDWENAAAIPEVFLTAYQTLFWLGNLQAGETVLIHAAGSGVGTAAIQLAKQISQVNVIATAGSAEKLAVAKDLGADVCINYKEENFAEVVEEVTDGKGADVILDFVGASYYEKNYQSIAVDGRWVLIGILGGVEVESVNLFDLMLKRVQLKGTLLTPRSDAYKEELSATFAKEVLPFFEEGKIKAVVDSVFRLEEMAAAHDRMENNENTGKIIVKP